MINLTDELLNKYIDNELSSTELNEVKEALNKDEDAVMRLRALRLVDNSLKKIETESAPLNITDKIMDVLIKVPHALKPKGGFFFAMIISVFSLGILAIFVAALKITDSTAGVIPAVTSLNQAKDFVDKNLNTVQLFFTNQNVLIVISLLSLILLAGIYFSIEAHKNFKNKLNSLPN